MTKWRIRVPEQQSPKLGEAVESRVVGSGKLESQFAGLPAIRHWYRIGRTTN
jgi:hypothetical protein